MNGTDLALACAVAWVTVGEQFYLGRPWRGAAAAAVVLAVYCGGVALVSGSWAATALFAAVAVAGRALSETIGRRRGPDLWSGLAAVVPPYLALWVAWAFGRPSPPAWAGRAAAGVVGRLALGATPIAPVAAHMLVLISAYVFCWGSATFLTRAALAGFVPQLVVPTRSSDARLEVAAASDADARGLGRAGRLIGDLERTLILSLALSGNFTAIGFVVAAKSIARWDLARTHAEYFLVGTLSSIGIALLVGMLARQALALG